MNWIEEDVKMLVMIYLHVCGLSISIGLKNVRLITSFILNQDIAELTPSDLQCTGVNCHPDHEQVTCYINTNTTPKSGCVEMLTQQDTNER